MYIVKRGDKVLIDYVAGEMLGTRHVNYTISNRKTKEFYKFEDKERAERIANDINGEVIEVE
ncbi:hypothetical protein [Aerococcus kribbianus]|uniref:Uncharacterized protein n=1 Tax=Aerococcus kribbianus TaxID=2999064 RepID=A0A9X3JDT5_9LACT|nr:MULTISPECIES: hypothetical protein [unclassified Aerococcus]MCZ0717846.1 hypothetical protein [Aerococcus sp. YH-aer221]MCZ0726133.1 hypothetical protein [Aerococcus sp. YH-aer222]